MVTTKIYAHVDPETFEVRYIGRSASPIDRWRCWIGCTVEHRWWIDDLWSRGLRPKIYVLEEITVKDRKLTKQDWQPREAYWIRYYRNLGYLLYNKYGVGPSVQTKESNLKRSIANRGRTPWNKGLLDSQETRERKSKSQKQSYQDNPEYRTRRVKRAYLDPNFQLPLATRQAMSRSHTLGNQLQPERNEARRQGMLKHWAAIRAGLRPPHRKQ